MHSVVRSDFLNGLLFLDRLQRDSCFHLRAEAPPLPRFHFCSLSEAAILYLIDWSEFWGAPQWKFRLGISSQFVSDPPMLLELNKGDLLVLAPDGFFEWTNEEGEQFGVKRVEETIRKSKEKRPNELISTRHAAVLAFSGGTKQQDDLTAVAIKRTQIMLYSALMIQVTSSSRPLTLRLKYRLPTRTDSRLSNSSVDASFL